MNSLNRLKIPLSFVLAIFVLMAALGFLGATKIYGVTLSFVAGELSSLFGNTIEFKENVIVIIKGSSNSIQKPLELPPELSYYALSLLIGLIAATPKNTWRSRVALAGLTIIGVLAAQSFLLTGFSIMDRSTELQLAKSKAMYSAWWSIGPLIFAAWWFWINWLPSIVPNSFFTKGNRFKRGK